MAEKERQPFFSKEALNVSNGAKSSALIEIPGHQAICVKFYPSNANSVLQPVAQGIIKSLK